MSISIDWIGLLLLIGFPLCATIISYYQEEDSAENSIPDQHTGREYERENLGSQKGWNGMFFTPMALYKGPWG